MKLEEFVANETVKYELSRAMQSDAFPHALIIDGARGTGKKTLAGIIAQFCVCLSDGEKPCGKCAGCLKAIHNSHPDIDITDGTKPGALSIEAVRKIRSDAFIKPNEAPKKAYLILDCDKMLPAAQNALLKILEEPPANVVFVITVSSANILLQTVRSRTRIYTLYPPLPEQCADYLQDKFPEKSFDELLSAAKLSDGNIGEVIRAFENGSEETMLLAQDMMDAVIRRKEYELLILTSRLSSSREFASAVLRDLLEISGECIRASVGIEGTSDIAVKAAEKLSPKKIYKISENIEKAANVLKSNVNLNFFGTWLCSLLMS